MIDSRWFVAFVVLAVVAATVPAAGSGADRSAGSVEASNESVSAFIHSSSTATERSLESALVDVTIENASDDDRAELIANRTDELEDRLDRLETERATLAEANRSTPENQTRTTQLSAEVASLERSVDRIEPRANEAGVDDQRLEELRSSVAELDESEVAVTERTVAEDELAGSVAENETSAGQTPSNDSGP